MGDERTLFQIAAALIPVLLFGGVLLERARPPRGELSQFQTFVAMSLPLFGVWAVYIEVVAIQVALTGDPTEFDRIAVIATMVLGSALIAAVIAVPWLERLRRQDRAAAIVAYIVGLIAVAFVLPASIERLDEGTRAAELAGQTREFEALATRYMNLSRRPAARRGAVSISAEMTLLLERMSGIIEEINRDLREAHGPG